MRPMKMMYGLAGSPPWRSRTSVRGSGAYSSVSMPLWITRTRSGAICGYVASTSARMPALTAMTASADSSAVRSAHSDSA